MRRRNPPRTLGLAVATSSRASAPLAPSVAPTYEPASATTRCPGERELRDRVVARLGRDPFVDGPDALLDARRHLRVGATAVAPRGPLMLAFGWGCAPASPAPSPAPDELR